MARLARPASIFDLTIAAGSLLSALILGCGASERSSGPASVSGSGGQSGGSGGVFNSTGGVAGSAGAAGTRTTGGGGAGGGGGSMATVAGSGGSGGTAGYIGDWSSFECIANKIRIVGTIGGAAVDITRDTGLVGSGSGSIGVQFGTIGDGNQAFVRANWLNGDRAVMSPLELMRVQFESPDPLAGIELCADGAAEGMREADRAGLVVERLVKLQCPGTAIAGSLDLEDARLHGNLGATNLDVAVQNFSNGSGPGTQSAHAAVGCNLSVQTDDQTGMASSGQITGGRLELRAPFELANYCVGSATFTRNATSRAVTAHFANLSQLDSCKTGPSVGTIRVCAQDRFLIP